MTREREVIRRALPRNRDGSASGPLGVVLDLLATLSCPAVTDQNAPPSIEEREP
jgi:hypothetical protein